MSIFVKGNRARAGNLIKADSNIFVPGSFQGYFFYYIYRIAFLSGMKYNEITILIPEGGIQWLV
jgi:hypothetical protein